MDADERRSEQQSTEATIRLRVPLRRDVEESGRPWFLCSLVVKTRDCEQKARRKRVVERSVPSVYILQLTRSLDLCVSLDWGPGGFPMDFPVEDSESDPSFQVAV